MQDGTLVNTKSNRSFPNDASDWKWYNKKTSQQLKDFHEDGFKLVIFT
jgi:histidinol phosphatase-like enzyme